MKLESIQRVVVTRLRWLGDVVMSTPMLEVLREALPQARIDYLTNSTFAPVLQGHPACDRVLTMDPKGGLRATIAAVRMLRTPRADWCFDTFGNPRSAILVGLAAPRRSVGPGRGIRSKLFTDNVRHGAEVRSAVQRQLDLLTPLLGPVRARHTTLYVSAEERAAAAARFELEPGTDHLIVHPGATRAERAWPLERWPGLIDEIRRQRPDLSVRLITQPGWEEAVERIVKGCRGDVRHLPVLPLRDLMAVLTHASVYMGNDGGVLHTAVALRIPTVGILGRTEKSAWFPYETWGPYRAIGGSSTAVGESTPDAPEPGHASVDEVLEAALQVLDKTGHEDLETMDWSAS